MTIQTEAKKGITRTVFSSLNIDSKGELKLMLKNSFKNWSKIAFGC